MEVFILAEDTLGTLHTFPDPIGIAVTSEDLAKEWRDQRPAVRAYQRATVHTNLTLDQLNWHCERL